MLSDETLYSANAQCINQLLALGIIVAFVTALKINVGLPPTIIVGASAVVGFLCWRVTNLRRLIDPVRTTLLFLLATAALHVHLFEEHHNLFGPAMSRLFNIAFPDERFMQIFVFGLPTVSYLTAIGLLLRLPLAAFVAWFTFIGLGIAEFTHFIFPFIAPALEPSNPASISAVIHGVPIADMRNHHIAVTGKYYIPGLSTTIIPMIPGGYSVWWLLKQRKEIS